MDKKTKELLVKMAGQPDSLRKDKFIREYRKYNKKNNKNTRNNENNVMSKDGWNNKNNENTKRNTNNETTLCFIMSQFSYISWYVWCISLFVLIAAIFIIVMKVESTDSITVVSASIPFVAMGWESSNRFAQSIMECRNWKVSQRFRFEEFTLQDELHRNCTYCNLIMFDHHDWKK